MSLAEDVQITKTDLDEFRDITRRILEYLPNVINEEEDYRNYKLCSSNIAGTRKQIRPTTKWNYGLVLDEDKPEDNFIIETKKWPADNYPFTFRAAPIVLKVKAKIISG